MNAVTTTITTTNAIATAVVDTAMDAGERAVERVASTDDAVAMKFSATLDSILESLADLPRELLKSLELNKAMSAYRGQKAVTVKEIQNVTPGTWVSVKWFNEPNESLIVIERAGFGIRALNTTTGVVKLIDETQVVSVLGAAKAPGTRSGSSTRTPRTAAPVKLTRSTTGRKTQTNREAKRTTRTSRTAAAKKAVSKAVRGATKVVRGAAKAVRGSKNTARASTRASTRRAAK